MTSQMKKKIIFSIPIILFAFYFITSCCKKDEICIDKLDGKYRCKVSGTLYKSSGSEILFTDKTIIQNVNILNDSVLLLDRTIGNMDLVFDTIDIIKNNIVNDSIYFNNYDYIISGGTPRRVIRGYFYKNKIYFRLGILFSPTDSESYDYYGKKTI